jgi:hypothetical protein
VDDELEQRREPERLPVEEDVTEVVEDPGGGPDDPGRGPGLAGER